MPSSKFSTKALEQKTPPHCKPCPPPSGIYRRPRTPLLFGHWYGPLPSWPDWFHFEFDSLPLHILIPDRWFNYAGPFDVPGLSCTFTYQLNPGRWDLSAQIHPAAGLTHSATGTAPYPPLKWEDDFLHVAITPQTPTDTVSLFVQVA